MRLRAWVVVVCDVVLVVAVCFGLAVYAWLGWSLWRAARGLQ